MNKKIDASPTYIEDHFVPVLASDGSILAGRRLFEVRPSSRQFRLLKALSSMRSGILRRDQLVSVMYADLFETNPTISMRKTANRYQSAVKTVSRLRLELEKFFGDIMPPGFDWVPWSEKLGGWILFRQGSVDQSRGGIYAN